MTSGNVGSGGRLYPTNGRFGHGYWRGIGTKAVVRRKDSGAATGILSRKLHAVETRYLAYDWELLAISANLDHWACYVHGRKRTTIYTDQAALQHILGQNKLTSCQWRHLDKLQQHDYEVKYYPGVANVVADVLSRIAYTPTPDTQGPGPVAGESLVNVVELHISASQEWLQDIQLRS